MATALALLRFSTLPRLHNHPAVSPPSFNLHLRPSPASRRPTAVCMSRSTVPATDRLVSALAYTLPFVDSLHYGRFLFARVPASAAAVAPILPLAAAYHSVPFASFVAFFALYLGVVRNPAFSHYVRYNAMQAVVLDVFLALPSLLQRVFGTPSRGIGFRVLEIGYHAVFVFSIACFVYSVINCILGKTHYLPIVASAAERQL
ncbi:protein TIC 20-II, chloroplastic-like [Zingiber officinale]|uniref:protein TIC 20-II, chloroplastic-like n=1 Tax=Zingiber officinale TaxID=94328 RepID=UPI001C4C33AA|nr:protein TIC 20-II, chloroplastic-like [Zingiber officinale]XP_042431013.1 protein TIC 20-II, chloroplastic-like [Zingiber officinale]